MAVPALVIDHVTKRFGAFTALDDVSFSLEQGEFFALLGPNGAGKTTLISCMAGLTQPDGGSVTVMGHRVATDYRAARMALGVVPQELVFDPFFTVRESRVFQSGYFGLKRNDAWIDEILDKLGLTSKAHANMRTLSGGMKRRVMVAQALVHRPPVIVLDEPTAGVDVALRQSLWAFIRELNQAGHTIVLTTHYLEEAETLCNRIALLKSGRVIALEDKTTLLQRGGKTREVALRLAAGAALPPDLAAWQLGTVDSEGWLRVLLPDIAQLDAVFAALRQAQLTVQDFSMRDTDLEQVFVQMMHQETPSV